jgi:hypothetical protein
MPLFRYQYSFQFCIRASNYEQKKALIKSL